MPYYFRSDTITVNGLTAYRLDTTNSAQAVAKDVISYTALGIRVWRRDVNGNEYEITAGTPVAQVNISGITTSGFVYGTWTCPNVTFNVNDALVIRVYGLTASGWSLIDTWVTPQLNYAGLSSSTWTVYYYIAYDTYTGGMYFEFGSDSVASRIEGIAFITSVSLNLTDTLPINVSASLTNNLPINVSDSLPINVSANLTNYLPISVSDSLPISMSASLSTTLPVLVRDTLPINMSANLSSILPINVSDSLPINMDVSLSTTLPILVRDTLPINMSANLTSNLPINVMDTLPINMDASLTTGLPILLRDTLPINMTADLSLAPKLTLTDLLPINMTADLSIAVGIPPPPTPPPPIPPPIPPPPKPTPTPYPTPYPAGVPYLVTGAPAPSLTDLIPPLLTLLLYLLSLHIAFKLVGMLVYREWFRI